MSSNRNNIKMNGANNVPKMRCKVCEDARMPESTITSHFTKNKDGSVACPTLLSQECRYCYRRGHTVKYCKIKEKNNAASTESASVAPKVFKPCAVIAPRLQSNAFSALDSDEESEPETMAKHVVVEEFPALSHVKPVVLPSKMSFATALTSAAPKPVAAPVLKHVSFGTQKTTEPKTKIRWADAESSDEEEEEEEDEFDYKKPVEVVDNSAW